MLPYLRKGLPEETSINTEIRGGYKLTVKCYGVKTFGGKNRGCPVGRVVFESYRDKEAQKMADEYNNEHRLWEEKIIYRPFKMGIGNIFKPVNLFRGHFVLRELNRRMHEHPNKKYEMISDKLLDELGAKAFEPYVNSGIKTNFCPDFY
ncbi:MAG: hypothetical protein NTU57_01815 [Candidatus Aenigmarchaeota archaeon]|nr:hypothetical protein [Candidatus Aenigmarchaeota archaeon]